MAAGTAALLLDPLMRGPGGWLSLAVAFSAFSVKEAGDGALSGMAPDAGR